MTTERAPLGKPFHCTTCKIAKPYTAEFFHANSRNLTGMEYRCRTCRNAKSAAYKEANRDAVLARERTRWAAGGGAKVASKRKVAAERDPIGACADGLVKGLTSRRARYGRHVDDALLSRDFLRAWLERQPCCEACRRPFVYRASRRLPGPQPSLDRIDSSGDYTISNTALICWRCNRIKSNFDASDLRMVADWLDNRSADGAGAPREWELPRSYEIPD